MQRGKRKISYIKKPFAGNSRICLPAAVLSLILWGVSLYLSVRLQGQGDLNVAAWGLSSLVCGIVALVYGGFALMEKEKNYMLAKLGMVVGGIVMIFWLCMIIVGILA